MLVGDRISSSNNFAIGSTRMSPSLQRSSIAHSRERWRIWRSWPRPVGRACRCGWFVCGRRLALFRICSFRSRPVKATRHRSCSNHWRSIDRSSPYSRNSIMAWKPSADTRECMPFCRASCRSTLRDSKKDKRRQIEAPHVLRLLRLESNERIEIARIEIAAGEAGQLQNSFRYFPLCDDRARRLLLRV